MPKKYLWLKKTLWSGRYFGKLLGHIPPVWRIWVTFHMFLTDMLFPYYGEDHRLLLEQALHEAFLPVVSYKGANYRIYNGGFDKNGAFASLESVTQPGTYIPDARVRNLRPPVG